MVNVELFEKASKSKWLKKVLVSDEVWSLT